MIGVLADDFTGAAEIAAAAHRRGLSAEVQTDFDPSSPADLISLDTNSRGLPAQDAAETVGGWARRMLRARPEWVYKKVDSVLRGPVAAELGAARAALGKTRVLLAPANPTLGRVIRDRRYLVGGKPLSTTDFSRDPGYPAHSSDVLEMLQSRPGDAAAFLKRGSSLPAEGIAVVEADSAADLAGWAGLVDEATLPAGASDFFSALLEVREGARLKPPAAAPLQAWPDTLFVCGSASEYGRSVSRRFRKADLPVLRMPPQLFRAGTGEGMVLEWADAIVQALHRHDWVRVTIEGPPGKPSDPSVSLTDLLARTVEEVLRRHPVPHLAVEGGSTVSSLVRRLGWRRLEVRRELAQGAVTLFPPGQRRPGLTSKPGSYPWPEPLWRQLKPR